LFDAVKRRDVKQFAALLAAHADVHAVLPDGATALAWAAFLDLPEMAGKLIDAGADVNAAGDYGETPLTLALIMATWRWWTNCSRRAPTRRRRAERRDRPHDRGWRW